MPSTLALVRGAFRESAEPGGRDLGWSSSSLGGCRSGCCRPARPARIVGMVLFHQPPIGLITLVLGLFMLAESRAGTAREALTTEAWYWSVAGSSASSSVS